jgi:hypothetical protein
MPPTAYRAERFLPSPLGGEGLGVRGRSSKHVGPLTPAFSPAGEKGWLLYVAPVTYSQLNYC